MFFGSVRRAVDAIGSKPNLEINSLHCNFDLRDAQAMRTAANLVRSSLPIR
jgi:hypothetical protein